jgi:hypothetical protein
MKNAYFEELQTCTASQFMLIKYVESQFYKCSLLKLLKLDSVHLIWVGNVA